MAVRFIPNPPGISLLGRTPAMAAGMRAWADYVADIVIEIAPYGEGEGGHYRDMVRSDGPVVSGASIGARVNAYKFTSGFLEFGTSDTPAYAPLRTAADAAGLTLSAGRA